MSVTSIRETARAWLTVYGIAARAWPFGAIARPLMSVWMFVTAGVIPGIALQQLLTAAAHRQAETALAWTAVLVTAGMSRSLMSALWNFVQSGLMWRTTQAVTQALMTASVAAPGIEHLENPAYADHMETARNHAMRASLLVDWVASAVGDAISVIAAAVILLRVQPLLLLPVVGAALAGIAALRTRSRALAFMAGTIPDQRLARRLASLATSRAAAEDIRLLGLSGWLRDRHRIVAGRVSRRIVASERGPVAVAAVGALIQALMLAVGVAILAVSTAGRPGAVGTLALGIVLLQAALVQAGMLGVMGADLAANTFAARRLLWLLNHRPLVTSPTDPRPVPAVLRAGIVVDGVSFAYPWGDGRPALGGVRFTLRAGTTVALVGDNGAGESTLVKLLCRYYDPTEGCITVDGVDLRALDLTAWRGVCTGSFQDFMRFHFLARESIGVGDLAGIDDLARVRDAACRGGAGAVIDRLPRGYETQLGTEFPDGTELSPGQWQKVALARALMREQPLLMILDEPTASLDAASEHALFEAYAAEAREARNRGAITLLVSHRFSTVAMADLIVVLDRGRVVEQGSHDDLLSLGGRYAELYELQAMAYR